MLQLGAKATGEEAIRGGGDRICADRKTEVRRRLPTCVIQSPDKSVRTPRSRKAARSGSMIQQENERRSHFKPEGHNSRRPVHIQRFAQCSFPWHDPETSMTHHAEVKRWLCADKTQVTAI